MAGMLGLRLLNRFNKANTTSNFRRWIATSNKKSDVSATATSAAEACPIKEEKRHWQSYGFSTTNELDDLNLMHNHGFFLISIGLVFSFFILCYRPESDLANWSQREAFLELRRREKLGLPLIDPNYVDPATIVLPSDEELGATEVII